MTESRRNAIRALEDLPQYDGDHHHVHFYSGWVLAVATGLAARRFGWDVGTALIVYGATLLGRNLIAVAADWYRDRLLAKYVREEMKRFVAEDKERERADGPAPLDLTD